MTPPADPRLVQRFRSASRYAAFFSIVAGGIVLTGWVFDISVFKSISPNWVAMKINAAFSFLMAGVSLWLLEGKSDDRRAMQLSRFFAAIVLLTGALIMVTDVILPGMNDREAVEKVQARRPGLKVIYTSGYTDNAIVHHGVLDAGIHFLRKPYTPPDLAHMARAVLDGAG